MDSSVPQPPVSSHPVVLTKARKHSHSYVLTSSRKRLKSAGEQGATTKNDLDGNILPNGDIEERFHGKNNRPSFESVQSGSSSPIKTMDSGVFPAEIWQLVCSHLTFEELIPLRLASRGLADIAAEFLITRLRFHTSNESLQRLQNLATHKLLRKHVKTIVYEASLLADIGCIHNFSAHYDLEHHKKDKPQPPDEDKKTKRAVRLYERNLKKFKQDVTNKFSAYRAKYEAQQEFVQNAKKEFKCLTKFPNLRELHIRTDARCRHVLSERFMDAFGSDCAVPMETESIHTVWQLELCLQQNLHVLTARTIHANFFLPCPVRPKSYFTNVFKSLRNIDIAFKPDGLDMEFSFDEDTATPFDSLHRGHLSDALGSARELEQLTITFDDVSHDFVNLEHILGDHGWPNLSSLTLEAFTTSARKLLDILKRQPKLQSLEVGFCRLEEGEWTEVLKRMRIELTHLTWFWTHGLLEDSDQIYAAEYCDKNHWLDGEKTQLAMCINMYVTDHSLPEFEEDDFEDEDLDNDLIYNPLYRYVEDFADEEDLICEYGEVESDMELWDQVSDIVSDTVPQEDALRNLQSQVMEVE